MKSEQAHALRLDDGSQVSYGVPDFPTAEEAADFLAHIRTEIEQGAAECFGQCCRLLHAQAGRSEDHDGSDDVEDEACGWQAVLGQAVSFAVRPSAQTRRLETGPTGCARRVLTVRGKGDRVREVTLLDAVIAALQSGISPSGGYSQTCLRSTRASI